ncbi:hypothetical protein MAHJHV57_54470 [Mycobacterium avium subsp. hominissuis]
MNGRRLVLVERQQVVATTYQGGRDDLLPFYEDETSAIHRRDPEAARAACVERAASGSRR